MQIISMRQVLAVWVCGVALFAQGAPAQSTLSAPTPKTAYYFDPAALHLKALVPTPPAPDSAQNKAELAGLHEIESSRTPEQVKAARADDLNENLFLYQNILGPGFNAAALPRTAELDLHVQSEAGVAAGILKRRFARPRPYQTDKTLHPVCEMTALATSYPSGHAMVGYLEGLALAEIVPEKHDAILARADDFAHNRLVCGVHYPSDTEASRRVAYAVFGYLTSMPKFQHELATAKAETRAKLGLPK